MYVGNTCPSTAFFVRSDRDLYAHRADRSDDICFGSNLACLLGNPRLFKTRHFNIAKLQVTYKISGCTSQTSRCESPFAVGVKIQLNITCHTEAVTKRCNSACYRAYAPFGVR